jgi:DNA-binding LytR/AlgR family response regulator
MINRPTETRSESRRGRQEPVSAEVGRLRSVITHRAAAPREYLTRIPVREGDTLILVPTSRVAAVAAQGERLIITTLDHQQHSMYYRLKNLEMRLDPAEFIRLSRGLLANVNAISRIITGPSGTNRVILENGDEVGMSRIQTQRLRHVLLGWLR